MTFEWNGVQCSLLVDQ